jgi:hypothetical protein
MNTTYFIATALLDILVSKVNKLNKRAKRHNLPPLKATVWTDKERKSYKGDYKVTPVTLAGDNPTVAGDWKLVAYLRNVRGGENMTVTHLTDNYRVPANLKNGTHCDHCKTNRYRKFVAVLRNDSNGEVKKIGSSCLQDFLPLTSIHSAAHWNTLEAMSSLADEVDDMSDCDDIQGKFKAYGVSLPTYLNLTEYLAYVCCAIRDQGEFVSKSKHYELKDRARWDRNVVVLPATADIANNNLERCTNLKKEIDGFEAQNTEAIQDYLCELFSSNAKGSEIQLFIGMLERAERAHRRHSNRNELYNRYAPNTQDWIDATAAIEFCEAELANEEMQSSDYISNMVAVVCGAENLLESKHCGLVASLVTLRQRDLDRKAREAAKAKLGDSEYFGEVKKRDTFTLTLTGTNEFYSDWGTTYLYRFVDANNNTAVWFSSKDCDLSKGETYQVKGTVKEHKTYRDTKQTVLTRCKVLG